MWFCGDLLRRMLMQLLDEHCFETRPQYCRGKRYSGFPARLALTLRCFFFLQCSTKLLFKVFDCDPRFISRAEDGTQTRDPQLGRLMLYRLSYFRKMGKIDKSTFFRSNQLFLMLCIVVGSDGFEPPKATPAELQSAPFGHSGNCPLILRDKRIRTPDCLKQSFLMPLWQLHLLCFRVAHLHDLLPVREW